jgi:hypothetical protein
MSLGFPAMWPYRGPASRLKPFRILSLGAEFSINPTEKSLLWATDIAQEAARERGGKRPVEITTVMENVSDYLNAFAASGVAKFDMIVVQLQRSLTVRQLDYDTRRQLTFDMVAHIVMDVVVPLDGIVVALTFPPGESVPEPETPFYDIASNSSWYFTEDLKGVKPIDDFMDVFLRDINSPYQAVLVVATGH